MNYYIIDDNEYDCKLLKHKLMALDNSAVIEFHHNIDLAVDRIKEKFPDIVFLDYELQNDNAFSFFEKLNMLHSEIPRTIILTGVDRGENIDSLLSLGAIDYFIKDNLDEANLKILISRTMANYRKIKDFSFYKKIVDSSPEIKLILDKQGRILYTNDSANKAFGDELIIGSYVEDILNRVEGGYYKLKNSERFYKIMPSKAWDENLSTLTLLNVDEELDQQHKLEDQAIKATNFSRMLVHDIKDNLSAGIQLADIVASDNALKESKDIYLLQQSLRNCIGIIDSLAAISGIKETKFDSMINLAYVIEDVVDSMNAKIILTTSCPHFASGNYNIFKTVFQNLVSNSIKHSLKGKLLEISVSTELGENGVIVNYIDNGVGVPDELIDTLFEDRVKGRKSPGMGLGLFIVKQALGILGGTIEATLSKKGAHFIIKMPNKPVK